MVLQSQGLSVCPSRGKVPRVTACPCGLMPSHSPRASLGLRNCGSSVTPQPRGLRGCREHRACFQEPDSLGLGPVCSASVRVTSVWFQMVLNKPKHPGVVTAMSTRGGLWPIARRLCFPDADTSSFLVLGHPPLLPSLLPGVKRKASFICFS